MQHLPNNSLIHTPAARIALARQRFFEEGHMPTGVVGQAVFESWARCLRLHGNPDRRVDFEPVTTSRTQLALLKNRALHQAWIDELPRLETVLGTTNCAAMLTDATGVLIGASCVGRAHEELMPVATRMGVNLSEDAVGTTAPGVAARTGRSVCVMGGEHFFDSVKGMHCAAAPIRDMRGQLAGVLDFSSEHMPFAFDAATVVGLYAGAIENRLLVAQSQDHLVVRFHLAPELLDSALVGLVGIDVHGRQAWENAVAQRLLSAPDARAPGQAAVPKDRLGLDWAKLAALPSAGAAPLTLPNGLTVWARADMQSRDGRRGLVGCMGQPLAAPVDAPVNVPATRTPVAVAGHAPGATAATATATATLPEPTQDVAPAPAAAPTGTPRLRESDLQLIQRTLASCGGNVSDAAARLGVSRGLVYRRLRAAGHPALPTAS